MPKNQALITFRPAQLYEGKEWYIAYYIVNPATEKMERKKIKLNHIKTITERKRFAKQLIHELNTKLYNGWNPFEEQFSSKGFKLLNDTLDIYLSSKLKELRPDSRRSYSSFVKSLKLWLVKSGNAKMYAVKFNKENALDFLESKNQEGISNLTYNNYRAFFTILWNWLCEHKYTSSNPFATIKKKLKEQKNRVIIHPELRNEILEYLESEDYNFAMVCLFVFHTLLRPKEITFLKPSCFNLFNQTIYLPGEGAKNKNERIITIPDAFMPYLVEWNFNGAANGDYIFGEHLNPGKKRADARLFGKKWEKLRKELNLDLSQKLYSLRDSGIVQMLNDGISPEEIMKQADHSSLEMTTIYAKHANPKGSQQIKSSSTGFSGNKKQLFDNDNTRLNNVQ